jgi:hypothetical protein
MTVGGIGLEPTTSAMSKQCSNQLSYPPRAGAYYKRELSELAIEGKQDLNLCTGTAAGLKILFFRVPRDRFLKTIRINSWDQVIREKDPMNPGGYLTRAGKLL